MSFRTEVILQVLTIILFFAVMFAIKAGQERRERVAYLEGRYCLDHSAAVQLAASEEVR